MAALQRGSWQVAAPQLEDYVRTRDELLRAASAVFTAMRGGVLRARIAAGIPFAEVPEALARALANGARGSCVLLA
jgi:NADPH:quinone reductase-like Zn-dependent oxidoreductase